jgi:hypothetical protein
VQDGAALRIGRGEVEPPNSCQGNRTGAHRAGLEGYPQVAIIEAGATKFSAGVAQGDNLGVGSRV